MKQSANSLRILPVFILCLLLISPSLASAAAPPQATYTASHAVSENEYDYITSLKSMSEQELSQLGYSAQEIVSIQNFSIEDALLERARLSHQELLNYGYSPRQIELLKTYDGSSLAENPQYRASLATLDGNIIVTTASKAKMGAYFTWCWSNLPLFNIEDIVGCAFAGTNSENQSCNVKVIQAETSCVVTYSSGSAPDFQMSKTVSYKDRNSFVKLRVDFIYKHGIVDYWARCGTFEVTIEEVVPLNDLYSGTFAFGLGHKTFGVDSFDISVSYDGLSPSIGIGLSFTSGMDVEFYQTLILTWYGSEEYFDGL